MTGVQTCALPISNLTSDNRLTVAERLWRIKEGLCKYCGEKGHFTANCPNRQKNTSARVAEVEEETPADETPAPLEPEN